MKKDLSFFSFYGKLSLLIVALLAMRCLGEDSQKVQLSLISESKTVGNESSILLGLRAKIVPGWKTYWRSPGIAGYGLCLTWEGSKNIKSVDVLWPLPHRAHTQMGQVNAYEGEVIFPLKAQVDDPSQPVRLCAQVDMLVCDSTNCLPIMETLTLDLPPGGPTPSLDADSLRQAVHKVPQIKEAEEKTLGPLRIQSVEIVNVDEIPPTLQVVLAKNNGVFSNSELPELFLEIKNMVVDAPTVSLSKDRKRVQYSAPVYLDANRTPTYLPNLVGKPVTLTIEHENEGFETRQTLQKQSLNFAFWGLMLGIAFIGGLILNIMPCVLPVLSLKILSVMRHGGGHDATVRQEFLATVLGILFSFILLASGAVFLKISGHAVGWGVQFQDPYFLIGLIGILTLFTCNLFGFFEFRLPSFLSSLGGISPHRESLLGSFLEGSLVTVLATPCTAPFLGTALTFALSRGILEIFLIFATMGLGLAFPFLLIAFFPKFATKLPKPGAWMTKVKCGFGFLLMLTAIWLAYVLIAEIGHRGALSVVLLMAAVYLILQKSRTGSEAQKRMSWGVVSLAMAASLALPVFLSHSLDGNVFKKDDIWHPFAPERIASAVKAGKTVFVNVTADWCLTCQANKYFALKNKAVLKALHDPNIVAMEADWTSHDPTITAYLKSFNQYGIPFYAIYGSKNPRGRFLGQILTPQKVLNAFKEEKGDGPLEKQPMP